MNIRELEAIGVRVNIDAEGNLRIKAAAGLLTPELLGAVANTKPAMVSASRSELVNFVNFDSRVLGPGTVQRRAKTEVHRAWLLLLMAVTSRCRFIARQWRAMPKCWRGIRWRRPLNRAK